MPTIAIPGPASDAQALEELFGALEAAAEGDFSIRLSGKPGTLKGNVAIKYNELVQRNAHLALELERVGAAIGREGRMNERMSLSGVKGTWASKTNAINALVDDLVRPINEMARVLLAVAEGDLSQKMALQIEDQPMRGEFLRIGTAVNAMVDQLASFAAEVTRVAREVGTEGKLGGQAEVRDVMGTWKDLTDNVNSMAGNLTGQVRSIAQVTTAVAKGDLSQKITVDAKGEILELKSTINTMVDQLGSFADEVTRVAREVGTEGKLGGQADVPGVSGTWKDLTDNVNFMAGNLTGQVRNIVQVTTAVSRGDLSQKVTVEAKGEVAALADTINSMTATLRVFAEQVTGVAREVGTEGKLGGQADVEGVSGTWKDLTDSVNFMAGNLTSQVRSIAQVTTAVAKGDLSQKITVEAKGEVGALANTINTMVDQLSSFAEQVTGVAREVGTEGKLGGQADVKGVSGTWKDLTANVNFMADNLTSQVRGIVQVTTAVARGDLSQKITVEAKGEVAALADTINTMVDQLSSFADEVTRVAREVGTDGKLGGQAQVRGVSGTWKDLTDNVNFMAGNLTSQVRSIAQVTTAVARGDLSQKVTVEAKGEVAALANTINTMVDQLSSFAEQVNGVAREVGTEGKLGGQADVKGVSGTWKDLTDNVNFMADNLTSQVRGIVQVTTAVARGDLSQKITVEAKGEVAALADTINTMVDQLSSFADEVTRVAREVGTDGKLGGQARVPGVSGTWKDLTDNVNFMAGNLTGQVRSIAQVTTAVAKGDLSQKITVEAKGEVAALANTINTMVDQLSSFAEQVTGVAREVGTEGRLGGQAHVPGVSGTWKDLTDNVNFMAGNLTSQVRSIAQVATAVAKGDLSQKITVEAKGEVAAVADTINTMVDQLRSFAAEVTRVAREVGTEGKLGGQAEVEGISGTWKGLTDNVNFMATNLTDQVRNIAEVTTAVARGDLSKKITVDARGEILELKNTINTMVDQLSSFAAEVTRVAREVGTEGKLGGQAEVQGVSGTWRRLTENVNQLAANLTTQVRAIAEVSTAVTQGDLTRSVKVEAQGEVAELKDIINQMIANLKATTQTNADQDWLKTNLAKIGAMMQGQRDLHTVSRLIMSELTPVVSAQHGAFFLAETENGDAAVLRLIASYGYKARKNVSSEFRVGEALVGQAALEKKPILITEAPPDYIRITSGLGEGAPVNVIVLPVIFEENVLALIELASFRPFSEVHQTFLEQLTSTIGIVLNTIKANMRTEELLEQSQRLAQDSQSQSEELQSQQEELQLNNQELQNKASQLAEQNRNIEVQNRQIETARLGLEEKAEQLALSSKYKSEFLANMSHELRTPLNSLLILSKLLSDNRDGNLAPKQIEFAETISRSGNDLLVLINDVLDLSKIEAGKMEVALSEVAIADVERFVERSFRHGAAAKGLALTIDIEETVPPTVSTDEQRLQQILKNLLSNALKFTQAGGVTMTIRVLREDLSTALSPGGQVIAFAVSDTGIGVANANLKLIFEAFQQADGTTNRQYGGTGLGLSISRELAHLLGGELRAESSPGLGSTFTLLLPLGRAAPTSRPSVITRRHSSTPFTPGPGAEPMPMEPATTMARRSVTGVSGGHGLTLPVLESNGAPEQSASAGVSWAELSDDRDLVQRRDRVLLVIESQPEVAQAALAIGRAGDFKVVLASNGDEGLILAQEFKPQAIIVGEESPAANALSALHEFKRRPAIRHIPVYVAGPAESRQAALRAGAFRWLQSPLAAPALTQAVADSARFIERRTPRLLVVEDDPIERGALVELLAGGDEDRLDVVAAPSSEAAIAELETTAFDCIVLDLNLPTMSGFVLMEKIKVDPRLQHIPIIVYTGRDLTLAEEMRLDQCAESVVIKTVGSPERLIEETTLFLHRKSKSKGGPFLARGTVFQGKRVLIIDDDVRNLFALTSALEGYGLEILLADSGEEGIEMLRAHPDVDLVLMDVMMPGMDGHQATRIIRGIPQFQDLPIITVTAKAMSEDREKSVAAGASDYLTKPVDVEQLVGMMRERLDC